MSWKIGRTAVLVTVLLGLAMVLPCHAGAATLTVTDLGDNGAPGQLRTLINAAAPGDTIVIPGGTITLTGPGGDDLNESGDLDIHKDLTIMAVVCGSISCPPTIIDGGFIDRVFDVFDPANVTISGVTVQNGSIGFPDFFQLKGAGIRNTGILTLTNVTVQNNRGDVGGIFNSGTLTLTNVRVLGNRGDPGDAGILNTGFAVLTNVDVIGNSGRNAGGIDNVGVMTLNSVIIIDNRAITVGGIENFGTATLTNVTINRNEAADSSGIGNFGTMTLTNVTVSENSETCIAFPHCPSAIVNAPGADLRLKNTIVAGDFGTNQNCAPGSHITSLGHNLESGNTCGFSGPGDLSNADPRLGLLRDNGGFTFFHALPLPGSPAIDAGSPDCPPPFTDQRGVRRPQGAACDIGAYEFASVSAAPIPTLSEWGQIILSLGLVAALTWLLRRRGVRAGSAL